MKECIQSYSDRNTSTRKMLSKWMDIGEYDYFAEVIIRSFWAHFDPFLCCDTGLQLEILVHLDLQMGCELLFIVHQFSLL